MNPAQKSVNLYRENLTSAAISQLIDVPAVFLCVLTAFSIDRRCCQTNCAETRGTQAVERHTHRLKPHTLVHFYI